MARRITKKDPILKEWPSGFIILETDLRKSKSADHATCGVLPLTQAGIALIRIFEDIEKADFGAC